MPGDPAIWVQGRSAATGFCVFLPTGLHTCGRGPEYISVLSSSEQLPALFQTQLGGQAGHHSQAWDAALPKQLPSLVTWDLSPLPYPLHLDP